MSTFRWAVTRRLTHSFAMASIWAQAFLLGWSLSPAWSADPPVASPRREALNALNSRSQELDAFNEVREFLDRYPHPVSRPPREAVDRAVILLQIQVQKPVLSSKSLDILVEFYSSYGNWLMKSSTAVASIRISQFLVEQSREGRIRPEWIDRLLESLPNDPVSERILLASTLNPRKNDQILREIAQIPLELYHTNEILENPQLRRAVSLLLALEASESDIKDRLGPLVNWVNDRSHPWRAAALLIARPELVSKLGIDFTPESLKVLAQSLAGRHIREARYNELYGQRQFSSVNEYTEQVQQIEQEVGAAYRSGFKRVTLDILHQFAGGSALNRDVELGTAALTMAESLKLAEASADIARLARAGLEDGPLPKGFNALQLRRDAIRVASSLDGYESESIVVRALTDSDHQIRKMAAGYLGQMSLGPGARARLYQILHKMDAAGVDLASHLHSPSDVIAALKKKASLSPVGASASDATCQEFFLQLI